MNKNPKRNAPCHPERPHVAKDFCENCYRVYRRSLSSEDNKLAYDLRHRHKLTLSEYREQEIKQSFKCAICRETSSKNLCVDHGHTTQVLRGLLCTKCNLILGCAQDNILILESAIRYLETNTIDFREVK